MPRAHLIYVVLHSYPNCTADHLIAAFTVKHELITWWRQCPRLYKDEFEVWRIRDGGENKSFIPNSELE